MRRGLVLIVVAFLLVGVALVDQQVGRPGPAAPPGVIASIAAPLGAESSSWYCAGSSGAGGPAGGTVQITNVGPLPVDGSIIVTTSAGTTVRDPLTIAARTQVSVVPSTLVGPGDWLASTVEMAGGGVVVSQVVQGPTGWAESACASTALPAWYFASGSTSAGSTMVLSLFNPTSTAAVVDTTFDVPNGAIQPQPYEGLVVGPGQLVVLDVGTYVQDRGSVSTVVSARSGRIVAEELQILSGSAPEGLTLRLGAPGPRTRWYLAGNSQPARASGSATNEGSIQFDVFNPNASAERVTLATRLQPTAGVPTGLGPLVSFVRTVAPGATWHFRSASSQRIAAGTSFAVAVRAGGAGVVLERIVAAGPGAASPQWGVTPGTGGTGGATPDGGGIPDGATQWVIPAPGVGSTSVPAGAAPAALSVQNPSGTRVDVTVSALVGGITRSLGPDGRLTITAGGFATLGTGMLASVAGDPLLVQATGPVTLLEDLSPAGAIGVVAFAGVPLSHD